MANNPMRRTDEEITSVARKPARSAVRYCSLGAVAGPIVGTLAWFFLGLLRPDYSSVSQPISALGVGPNGWLMDVAFVVSGLLIGIGVIAAFAECGRDMGAIGRYTCMALLMISPLGLVWIGIFTMDKLVLHAIGAQLALGAPIITFLVSGVILRHNPRWHRFGNWLLWGSPFTLILLIGFIQSVPPSQFAIGGGNFGLWQRSLATEVLGWYAALGWIAFRRASRMNN
jgi:hypothetical membrane protein